MPSAHKLSLQERIGRPLCAYGECDVVVENHGGYCIHHVAHKPQLPLGYADPCPGDISSARGQWLALSAKLTALSDEIREQPRFKGLSPDCQLLADAVATVMAHLSLAIRIDDKRFHRT